MPVCDYIYDLEGYCNLSVGYVPKGNLVPNHFRNERMTQDQHFLKLFENDLKSIEKYKQKQLSYVERNMPRIPDEFNYMGSFVCDVMMD